jgi:sodium-dependent dicarboxylate transporter 2/3/5
LSHKTIGLILGPVLFLLILSLPAFESFHGAAERMTLAGTSTMSVEERVYAMQVVFALLALMVTWWLTEAIPLPATALLPAVILPWFRISGVHDGATVDLTLRTVLVNYASPVIFLFLGGFLIAAAMQKWQLDRRFTLWFLTRGNCANDSHLILLGIMVVTAFLSMWISNTATAAIMLPLGLGILRLMGAAPGESRYGTALMLGIAWSASVGGIGTIIGTPPNGIALGILDNAFAGDPEYQRITFLDWMAFGVPYVVLFLPVIWFVLLRMYPPESRTISGGKEKLLQERAAMNRPGAGERGTILVFIIAVTLWVTNPFWPSLLPGTIARTIAWVDEYAIGLGAGLLLFLIPANLRKGEFVLSWKDTRNVDWGTLILFGGGIALSDAMFKTGVAAWIATSVTGVLGAPSTLVMMLVIVLLVDLLTEVTSNTAVTSMIVPVVISVAIATGQNPVTLAVAAALAASMAFMLPVATPPNAIVFGSGYIRLGDMIKAGFILDILGWFFTVAVVFIFAHLIFGILSF